MSVLFYTFRNGKHETCFKYESVDKIWFTKDKKENRQVSVFIGVKEHSAWGLTNEDIDLTRESLENACKKYNEMLLALRLKSSKKRKRKGNVIIIPGIGMEKKKRKKKK